MMAKQDLERTGTKNSTGIPAHIDRELFCDWQEGRLKGEAEAAFLGRIGACTFCAERFGDWMEDAFLLEIPGTAQETMPALPKGQKECSRTGSQALPEGQKEYSLTGSTGMPAPPKYLREEILNRAHQLDIQAARKIKETSRQMQLLLYSMKVGIAVALSIFLLVLTTNLQNMDLEPVKSQRAQQMQEWHREAQERKESRAQDGGLVNSLRRGSREITGVLNDLANGFFRVGIENESDQEVTR